MGNSRLYTKQIRIRYPFKARVSNYIGIVRAVTFVDQNIYLLHILQVNMSRFFTENFYKKTKFLFLI